MFPPTFEAVDSAKTALREFPARHFEIYMCLRGSSWSTKVLYSMFRGWWAVFALMADERCFEHRRYGFLLSGQSG